MSAHNGSHRFIVVFVFHLVLDFWLLGQQRVSPFHHLFIIWAWHRHWIRIYSTQIFPFSSLTVAWHSCIWWSWRAWGRCRMTTLLSWRCRWGWRMRTGRRTRWPAGNHNRSEVVRIALYPKSRFLMWWGFWPLIQKNLFSSQSFPSDKTAGVISRTFIVKNISNVLTYTAAFSCVCTSPLAVMFVRRTARFRQGYPLQQNSSLFCWSCASTRRSRQQILVLQV